MIRVGLTDMPPFTSAAIRFAIAAAFTAAIAPRLARIEGGTRAPWWLVLTLGSTNFGVSYAAVYLSETKLASGLAAVLWSVFPMLMAISGHLFLPGERLRAAQFVGFALGLAGVALLFATDLRVESAGTVGAGLILLVSPIVSTIGTTVIKRHGRGVSSTLLNRDALWVGAAWLALGALVFEREAPIAWTGRAAFSIVYLALVATSLAFGLYFWLLRHESAHRMSLISYVTPVIALAIGWGFGNERVGASTIVGAGAIWAGIVLVLRRPARASSQRSLEPSKKS